MAAPLRRMLALQVQAHPFHTSTAVERPAGPSAATVRNTFLRFFRDKQRHLEVRSAPVVPRADPSLLFVNAGMNQFKPLILGTVDPRSEMATYRRVVNTQKCVRAGGKHNDLEDVGRDHHHLTFFEMLGNWSFGDFFKEEACAMAWELLTDVYGIPADTLSVTYFGGSTAAGLAADTTTRDIWLSLGLPADRVIPLGMDCNFWEMGETGPCGPCTEIHFHPLSPSLSHPSPSALELWNLVFMQYHRDADGSLLPLPWHSVDTGMGLERLVAVLQGKTSNYDTDLFTPILDTIHQVSGAPHYGGRLGQSPEARMDTAYRVLADHARALTICIADGSYLGMSGAPLVLRQILRRAVRFSAEVLRAPAGLLAAVVPTVVETLGDVYPELRQEMNQVVELVSEGEAAFMSSLHRGRRLIDRTLGRLDPRDQFPVEVAWSLHRNLGFPLDLIGLMLEEKGIAMDTEGLDQLANEEAEMRGPQGSDAGGKLNPDPLALSELQRMGIPFTDDSLKYFYNVDHRGRYDFPRCTAVVLALIMGRDLVSEVGPVDQCWVVLDRTNFYSEQGGQTSDRGFLVRDGQQDVLLPVLGVQLVAGFVLHAVTVPEGLRVGDRLELFLDEGLRLGCMVKHTATHLLNWAVRRVLGPQTEQRGSHVTADRLRLDVSIKSPITELQLEQLECAVRTLIAGDLRVYTDTLPLTQAQDIEGLRTVNELYPDPVRVVSVGVPVNQLRSSNTTHNTSVELCCGTHLLRTGLIQDLVITSEKQLGKSVSRLIAVTGLEAKQARLMGDALCKDVNALASQSPSSLQDAQRLAKDIGRLTDAVDGAMVGHQERRRLQHRLRALQRASNSQVRRLEEQEAAKQVQMVLSRTPDRTLMVETVDGQPITVLGKMVKLLSEEFPECSVLLLSPQLGGKVLCVCRVSGDLRGSLSAVDWARAACAPMDGSAGGSDFMAKGVGTSSDLQEVAWNAEQFARDHM